jgi:predicted amidophosphoribosyltransferase
MAVICSKCGKWYDDWRAPEYCVKCGKKLPVSK